MMRKNREKLKEMSENTHTSNSENSIVSELTTSIAGIEGNENISADNREISKDYKKIEEDIQKYLKAEFARQDFFDEEKRLKREKRLKSDIHTSVEVNDDATSNMEGSDIYTTGRNIYEKDLTFQNMVERNEYSDSYTIESMLKELVEKAKKPAEKVKKKEKPKWFKTVYEPKMDKKPFVKRLLPTIPELMPSDTSSDLNSRKDIIDEFIKTAKELGLNDEKIQKLIGFVDTTKPEDKKRASMNKSKEKSRHIGKQKKSNSPKIG